MSYAPEERRLLHEIARRSIEEGLAERKHWMPDLASLPPALIKKAATFVTLHRAGHLRGCVGSIYAELPLAEDVAQNAYRSAFQDTRFAPLSSPELADLDISISVLTPFEPLQAASEEDLIRQLTPVKDGLYLEADDGRATFLPDVWRSLPDPRYFIRSLKQKAGLLPSYPFTKIRWSIYHTEKV